MTPHQKALIWVGVLYLFVLDQMGNVIHSPAMLLIDLVLLPALVYAMARGVMVAWRVRVIVLPHEEFTPRCPLCEEKGLSYSVERIASKVIERWNSSHVHSVKVQNSTHMECNRGHFVQFRVKPKVVVKRYNKRSLADHLRALRKGFHDMHFPSEELDTQGAG